MTKEELKQEAEELIQRFEMANSMNCYMSLKPDRKQIGEMLVMIAEPREKRIVELEKENAELKTQIEKMKSDVMANIKWADKNCDNMWQKLVKMWNQWEIKEK